MRLNTIVCDVSGCETTHTEEKNNAGHPGWGHVAGLYNDVNGSDIAHLCPAHLLMVGEFLNKGTLQ